jgi:hypothetical protein
MYSKALLCVALFVVQLWTLSHDVITRHNALCTTPDIILPWTSRIVCLLPEQVLPSGGCYDIVAIIASEHNPPVRLAVCTEVLKLWMCFLCLSFWNLWLLRIYIVVQWKWVGWKEKGSKLWYRAWNGGRTWKSVFAKSSVFWFLWF